MYREVRAAQNTIGDIQSHLDAAILASEISAISNEVARAQALTVQLIEDLKRALEGGESEHGRPAPDANLVRAAVASLNVAWTHEEKIGLALDASAARASALQAKTEIDYAAAYLQAAIGFEAV